MGKRTGATINKSAYRKALPGQMANIHAKVVAEYGKNSAQVVEIFPEGLSIFSSCRDEQLENKLGVTVAAITAHQADLGQDLVDEVGALLSAWISTSASQGGAKSAKKLSGTDLKALRKALEAELQKNALFVAQTCLLDKAKGMFYLPQELLHNPTPHVGVPGAALIQQVNVDGLTVTLRMQSLGAVTMKLLRRGEFELEAVEIEPAIPVVNGVAVQVETAPAAGLWFYTAVPVNEGGEGAASAELGVQVS